LLFRYSGRVHPSAFVFSRIAASACPLGRFPATEGNPVPPLPLSALDTVFLEKRQSQVMVASFLRTAHSPCLQKRILRPPQKRLFVTLIAIARLPLRSVGSGRSGTLVLAADALPSFFIFPFRRGFDALPASSPAQRRLLLLRKALTFPARSNVASPVWSKRRL